MTTTQCITKQTDVVTLTSRSRLPIHGQDKVHKGKWTGRELPVEGVGALMTSQFI